MTDVHGIILNWNGWRDTIECVDSLLKQEDASLEIIIVDNGSLDDSVARIRAGFPSIQIIETGKNLGFAGGMNVGIRAALDQGAENLLLINNDTLADKDMVRLLLKELMGGVGVTSPAIFYAGEPNRIWSIGGNIHPVILEVAASPHRNITLPAGVVERDFFAGCAILVRAEVFRKVGLFDERYYPAYYEDLDYSIRVRRNGYRMVLVPQAHLWHKVSQSSGGANSPRVYYLMARNSAYYFRKHMRLWQAPFILAYRLLSALKTTLRLMFSKNWQALSAYWTGLACGWTGIAFKSGERFLSHYR